MSSSTRVVSPAALADWSIQTGRLAFDQRQTWLAWYDRDSVAALGSALSAVPTREPNRPCPLFVPLASGGSQGRYGHQPARVLLDPARTQVGFLGSHGQSLPQSEGAAAWLTSRIGWRIASRSLSRFLNGFSVPPAEVKLLIAELLMVEPEQCWTPEVMAATYLGGPKK